MTAPRAALTLLLSTLALGRLPFAARAGRVIINEISDKGTEGICGGEDWIELYHVPDSDADAIELGGYVLHDEKGPYDEGAFTFPSQGDLSEIYPGQYVVLCTKGEEPRDSPQFGIRGDDSLTLLTSTGGELVSNVGPLFGRGRFDVTYIRLPDGTYDYTTVPTPGGPNVYAPPDASEQETEEGRETAKERKARLAERNALGERFFGMGLGGLPVPDRFEDVLDLKIAMNASDFDYTMENPAYKVYRPFQSAKVLRRSDGTEVISLSSPGRIRTKGRFSLIYTACIGIDTIPFSLDFDNVDEDQTLFGVARVYLRNQVSDQSYMREWALHRILARFGLPYLRTRKVRFFVNDILIGLYDLMEAPDHEHVFARSFPDYDPENFALYKVKDTTEICSADEYFTPEMLAGAAARVDDTSTPPYAWERGEHRKKIDVLGKDNWEACLNTVWGWSWEDFLVAYLRHDEDCGKTAVEVGLLDRDLGHKSWDPAMSDFFNKHLIFKECSAPGCPDSELASDVDLTNFLKSLAFYAVTLSFDGPLTKGKNLYLAQSGDGKGWKIVPWDLDGSMKTQYECDVACRSRWVHWSILRPTCENIEKTAFAGPLLSDPVLLRRYADYARELSTIMADSSFLQELMDHANAIRGDAESDVFIKRFYRDYSMELSPDAGEWDSIYSPFLPTLAARTEDVIAQLDALDSCSDIYRPMKEVDSSEKCVDWRKNPPPPKDGNTDTDSSTDKNDNGMSENPGIDPGSCNDDNPCFDGLCCSQYNFCGNTSEHCQEESGCKSNCWVPMNRRTTECLLVNSTMHSSPHGPSPQSPPAQSPTEIPAQDSSNQGTNPTDPTSGQEETIPALTPQSAQQSFPCPAKGLFMVVLLCGIVFF